MTASLPTGSWWSTTSPTSPSSCATALRYEGFDVAHRRRRPRRPPAVDDVPARPGRARRHAARPRRLRRQRRLRRRAAGGAGALPHRPRRHRGQGPRPHHRRRRLRDQAVQPRGAGRPRSGPSCAAPARRAAAPSRLRFADLELDEDTHEVWRAGRADRAHADRVQAAALPARQPAPGALEGADPRPRVAATTSAATRTWSRPTSATCARRSTRTGRRSSTPCAGVGYSLAPACGLTVSLRARLLAVVLVLLTVGLGVADIATYRPCSPSCSGSVDNQLHGWQHAPGRVLGPLTSAATWPGVVPGGHGPKR